MLKVSVGTRCRQIPREEDLEVCVDVDPMPSVREECRNVTREQCDVVEKTALDQDCKLRKTLLPSMKR